jgi:hypothetical protein
MKDQTLTPEAIENMPTTFDGFDHGTAVYRIAEIVRACEDDTIGEGCGWYDGYAQTEARMLARDCDVSEATALYLAVVCNINASWRGGLTRARRIAEKWARLREHAAMVLAGIRGYSARTLRRRNGGLDAVRIAVSRVLLGQARMYATVAHMPKIGKFYRNIALRDFAVCTIDRWAARAIGINKNPSPGREYAMVEDAYIDAAHEVGLPPACVQAIVWIAVRGSGV